ncbi:MAG: 4Fe-4S ferredoxin [Proteobacteria bacterium]|nr:4Fe-4S ferredoxin [Pseudomonadota bacterium]
MVSFVVRLHKENVRSAARTAANLEFVQASDETDEVARRLAITLEQRGIRAINPPMAFPFDLENYPERGWVVSHKVVAEAAQLGRMGLHRSVIHPRFGSFIVLGTVITNAELAPEPSLTVPHQGGATEGPAGEGPGRPAPLEFNPCVNCKLCVAACPVGAIEPDGGFRFSACYDHNYREFMTGFGDFVEHVVESRNKHDFRDRVSASETVATWQSLAFRPSYKAAYCVAVCPAGEEVLGPFVEDRASHLREVVKPLTQREETVYAVRGSDAAEHVQRRFKHKKLKLVASSLRPSSPRGLFRALHLIFQRRPARGWRAVYHFDLTGVEPVRATVTIDDGRLEVQADQLLGRPDITVRCDGKLWLDIVSQRRSPVWAVITGRLKTTGDRSLLQRFAACFPR